MTTFSVDRRMAGERLARLLVRRIRGEHFESLRETAPAAPQPGGSDGPPAMTSNDIAGRAAAAGIA